MLYLETDEQQVNKQYNKRCYKKLALCEKRKVKSGTAEVVPDFEFYKKQKQPCLF